MPRKPLLVLLTLGTVAAIVAGIAGWSSSDRLSSSQIGTPAPFVLPRPDPATARALWQAKKLCHEQTIAYDPLTRTPDLSGCDLNPEPGSAANGQYAGRDFTGANFSETILVDTIFAGANLTDANLTGVVLRGLAEYSDFSNANFTGANLAGADLATARLDGANFTNANLNGAYFYGMFGQGASPYEWASFNDVIWANTICPDGTNSDSNGGTCAEHLHVGPSHLPLPTPDYRYSPWKDRQTNP